MSADSFVGEWLVPSPYKLEVARVWALERELAAARALIDAYREDLNREIAAHTTTIQTAHRLRAERNEATAKLTREKLDICDQRDAERAKRDALRTLYADEIQHRIRVMKENDAQCALLAEARSYVEAYPRGDEDLLERIDAALARKEEK